MAGWPWRRGELRGHREAREAEVAFAVPDDMHRCGIATLLLEHLASLARQRGLRAFIAETLAENSAMLRVFADAGLPAQRRASDGVVELTFPLPGSEPGRSPDGYRSRWPAGRAGRMWPASVTFWSRSRSPS